MQTVLHINASLFSAQGESSRLASRFVAGLRELDPAATVIERDLAANPVPHLDAARFQSFLSVAGQRSAEQQTIVDYSDDLIDELRRADTIVLGLPMYNFGVPSQLKAYFDHVARAGETFRYTANGPEGLLTGKKAYVLAARGGLYAGTPQDSQTDYVRAFLGFIGIADVAFVYAEGLAMGDEPKRSALADAHHSIDTLLRAGEPAVAA